LINKKHYLIDVFALIIVDDYDTPL